jgi:hypothetical protein
MRGLVGSRAGRNDVEGRKFLILLGLEFRPLCRSVRSHLLYRLPYKYRNHTGNRNTVYLIMAITLFRYGYIIKVRVISTSCEYKIETLYRSFMYGSRVPKIELIFRNPTNASQNFIVWFQMIEDCILTEVTVVYLGKTKTYNHFHHKSVTLSLCVAKISFKNLHICWI